MDHSCIALCYLFHFNFTFMTVIGEYELVPVPSYLLSTGPNALLMLAGSK